MSTNSVIAIPDGDSWVGVFCYSDGYPTWQLRAIRGLVDDLGLNDAKKILTSREWRQIHPFLPECQPRDTPVDMIPGWSFEDQEHLEWAYILRDDGVEVIRNEFGHLTVRGVSAYDSDPETDSILECGPRYEHCKCLAWAHFDELEMGDTMTMHDFLHIDHPAP